VIVVAISFCYSLDNETSYRNNSGNSLNNGMEKVTFALSGWCGIDDWLS